MSVLSEYSREMARMLPKRILSSQEILDEFWKIQLKPTETPIKGTPFLELPLTFFRGLTPARVFSSSIIFIFIISCYVVFVIDDHAMVARNGFVVISSFKVVLKPTEH